MPTILHAIETHGPGGAESVLLNLLGSLDPAHYRNVVILHREGWLSERVRALGVDLEMIPQEGILDWTWVKSTRNVLKKYEVDLIHAHEYAMNVYCSLISRMGDIPCVTTVHGKNYYADKWRRRAAYRFASRHSHMVAVSEDIRSYLVGHVRIEPAHVNVIHNGVNMNACRPDERTRQRLRQELGIADDVILLGAVGNLYPVKGHAYLLTAFAHVRKRWPQCRLFVAGRGNLLDSLQEQAQRLGIAEHVLFLGLRNDVPDLLQAMDIFVMPSESEGIPLSLLEAMAAGKPAIVTRVGGMPEVVNGGAGEICASKDPVALADCMMKLLGDRELRQRLGEAGRRRIEQQFSLGLMLERYTGLYRAMTSPKSARQITG